MFRWLFQQVGWWCSTVYAVLIGQTRIFSLSQRVTDLYTRYTQLRALENLNAAIVLAREALSLYSPGHPRRSTSLNNLTFHLSRYAQLRGVNDIEEAAALTQEALSLYPPGYLDRSSLSNLGLHLSSRAFVLAREAFPLFPPGHTASLNNLAARLSSRYRQRRGTDELNEAIVSAREALSLHPPGHPLRSTSLNTLTLHLSSRCAQLQRTDDIEEIIVYGREALSLCPPGHPARLTPLSLLATSLSCRHTQLDLNEAIVLGREAVSLCPPGHPLHSSHLTLLLHLFCQYDQLGGIVDLNEAVVLGREALLLYPHEHLGSKTLNSLASLLRSRYRQLGDIDDLDEAIVLVREALSLCPPTHPDHWRSLGNLASYLCSRYDQLGDIDDLNEAIVLGRESLPLSPPGHTPSLNNLAGYLSTRYRQLGGIGDLDEAIVLARKALSLCPHGHPDHPASLNNLAGHLSSRYDQLGGIDDLNEAIVLAREALLLFPSRHAVSLNNLAAHLSSRYRQLGGIDDLNEAIVLAQESISLCPPGHPLRSRSLKNLAHHLSSRYERSGDIEDLNEAIALGREALSFFPPGHLGRARSLDNLAVHLALRSYQLRGIADLDEAIALGREALSLDPPGHLDRSKSLSNLAAFLASLPTSIDNLNEAIVLAKEAHSLSSPGHPEYSTSLNNLARYLISRYDQLVAINNLDEATNDKQELFRLYTGLELVSQTISSLDLTTAKQWIDAAEQFAHPTTLRAYGTALRLLVQHLAALPSLPKHLDLLKSLSSSLAADAFSACLRNQSPSKAVELLEQGRAVFWNQLARLRSPLNGVITFGPQGKALADEFTSLTSAIRNALNSAAPDQHDRVCRLNVELEKVVSKIRELPGFARFLLPSLFSDLQTAAKDGPVIIMNASKYGCDALVVFSDKDPIHIPLPVTKKDVQGLSLQLSTLRKRAKTMTKEEMEKCFKVFLRKLWDTLVSQIVDVLQTTCPFNSRIWWCPTAEFSLLPLHAASPYRPGQKGLSDLYVSSYTTTLNALIRARRAGLPDSPHDTPRFIAIGQAAPEGASKLYAVGAELDKIGQLVDGLTTFRRIEGEDARISTVADELGKNDWAHFACHGIPKQETPFESAFALRDGGFTIEHISQCDFQNPQFAYLSACHTTVGDKESPDEVIHLAAAMQFAGFRSVIGTMWAVDDSQTNKVISKFYEMMVGGNGRLDYTRAARALRFTMKKVDIPMDQRILYIHLGA